ncbi:hypothetical protein SCHPADRAFT_903273 [Schizopora paradoxa]|uniref:DUF803-domain-containing protein n=1 Tax=Schizopora paradoxa TaxID=27342 RepID=A0A0H2RRK2_9AGAM|nr:hypothetical protein SCHPADRAFT_903273 [Schizopora paradoxa]
MAGDDVQVSVAVGIIVGLLASFVQSLGLTIQRKSHVLNQDLPEELQRVEHRRPLWLLGFGIFISSNILGSLFQIASLPVVILAPLGAVSLLWNAFFARIILGDVFSPWMLLGTILIAGGAVLIAEFGIVPEPSHSLEDLLHLLRRPAFIVYFSLLGMAVLICLIITHVTDYSLSKKISTPLDSPPFSPHRPSPSLHTLPLPPPGDVARGITENTPLLDRKSPPTRSSTPLPWNMNGGSTARTRMLLAISYASVSGLLSGMCLIFAKSGVELLLLTISGKNQFWRWESWVLLLGLVGFALLQLWYLHKGLVYADPTIVCPLAFCFYNLSSIVNGLVYYDQVAMLSALKLCLVGLGMVVLLGGVWVVSFQAGGGRVDVGTWQEGDDDVCEEEEETQTQVLNGQDLETEVHVHEPPPESALSDSTYERPVLNPRLSIDLHGVKFPSAGNAEEAASHSNATLHPSSPTHSRHPRRHRFSFIHSPDSPNALNVPTGGLSIGLSPISPGFAIVPKHRASGLKGVVRRAVMRRTVSESDACVGGINTPATEHGDPLSAVDSEQGQEGSRRKANARWKWLRGVFTSRDG